MTRIDNEALNAKPGSAVATAFDIMGKQAFEEGTDIYVVFYRMMRMQAAQKAAEEWLKNRSK